jgi:hypothetical protein
MPALPLKTLHIKSITHTQQDCYVVPKKLYTLAGFEPGPSVPEVDAMATAPRRRLFWSFQFLVVSVIRNVLGKRPKCSKHHFEKNMLEIYNLCFITI